MEMHMRAKNLRGMLFVASGIMLMLSAARVSADQNGWVFDIGAGTSPTVGNISNNLKTGWNIDVRGGREFDNGLGLLADVTYNELGISNDVLQALKVPNGNGRLWSVTAGPMWRFPIASRVRGYVMGGVGWYRRTVEFTQPTIGVVTVIDPWWGYIGPALVPANQILGSVTDDAFGGNAGGGLSVDLGDSGTAVFVEARYHIANTKPTSTAIVPVSFGLRWTGRRGSTSRP
jgi:hypothetical protein